MKNRFIKYILVYLLLGCVFICGCTKEKSHGLTETEEIDLKDYYIQEYFNGKKAFSNKLIIKDNLYDIANQLEKLY